MPLIEPRQVVVAKLDDLQHRVRRTRSIYDLLMAGALLRDLLIGTPEPQLVALNREHRLRLRFAVVRKWSPERAAQLQSWVAADGLDPDTSVGGGSHHELDLSAFLGEVVLFEDPDPVTVRDIIDWAAHVIGGIHFGDPDKRNRPAVERSSYTLLNDVPAPLHAIAAIGRVTIKAAAPLVIAARSADPT